MNELEKERTGGTGFALGRHMTVEFYDCNSAVLADVARLREIFLAAAKKSGATVIDVNFHEFQPQGVSGVVIISESHFAVHAWPEHDYAAVDLFTCGEGVDFDVAIDVIARGIGSRQWIVSSVMNRGIVGNNGIERLVPVVEGKNARFSLSWRSRFEETHAHALSASIDVYECHSPVFGSRELLPDFTMKFARTLGRTPAGSLRFDQCAGNCLAFEQPVDGGLFSGRMDLDAKTAYLDVFVAGYFDPRGAAESAIRELGGSYYRLQPHVRQ